MSNPAWSFLAPKIRSQLGVTGPPFLGAKIQTITSRSIKLKPFATSGKKTGLETSFSTVFLRPESKKTALERCSPRSGEKGEGQEVSLGTPCGKGLQAILEQTQESLRWHPF
jgi:hypothetical protein